MAAPLWVTIPRCEETFERKNLAAASSARTVFVLEVHSKAGGGVTQTWSLNKRYGYFARIDRVASRFGASPPWGSALARCQRQCDDELLRANRTH